MNGRNVSERYRIEDMGYSMESLSLEVEFGDGTTVELFGVPPTVYDELVEWRGEGLGQFVRNVLVPRFRHRNDLG